MDLDKNTFDLVVDYLSKKGFKKTLRSLKKEKEMRDQEDDVILFTPEGSIPRLESIYLYSYLIFQYS